MKLYEEGDLIKSLEELSVINPKDLKGAIEEAGAAKKDLGGILLARDLISGRDLAKVVSDLIGVPFVDLSTVTIDKEVLMEIPEIVAKKQRVVAFKKDGKGLHLAMSNPKDREIIGFIEKKSGQAVVIYLAAENDIDRALNLYIAPVEEAFDEIIKKNIEQVKNDNADVVEPPIIKIVETMLTYAYKNRASDVHIEPLEDKVLVRFRIDGVLHDIVNLPLGVHQQIVTRIKVMGKLRTDEHQAAQDGKIQFQTDEEKLDIRVSIVPVVRGEKVVMRLLSEKSRQFSLLSLGFGEKDMEKVKAAYEKPHGMILSTGPTGCGKTTTMYALLKLLDKRDVNIMTIEDPVEYDIEGVNQIQVNDKTGLSFANGLRSILRQDPNVILVGEVRDSETAGIAINAAMTGHLVLSTLHTNDAATAIPRLLDMGIEPFLVASTVNLVIAQRLVRKICTNCRFSLEIGREEMIKSLGQKFVTQFWGKAQKLRIYQSKGCPLCHQSGYQDRVGIFETMVVDGDLREAITSRRDAETIKKIAVKMGMRTMVEDGIEKIKNGVTTVEEVLRVISSEQ